MPQRRTASEVKGADGQPVDRLVIDPSSILNGLIDPVIIIAPDGAIHYYNLAAAQIFNLKPAQDHDRNIRTILDPAEARLFSQEIEQLLANDVETFRFYFHKDSPPAPKRCFELVASNFVPAHDKNRMITLAIREIEPGGHAIQFLESKFGYKTYWNWRNDFRKRLTFWPPALCAVAGIPPEAGARMTAEQVRAVIHPRDRDVLRDIYKRVLNDQAPVVFHSRVKTTSGGYINCFTHGFVERDEQGAPTGFVGFTCDITKEVEAIRMLRNNETQLRELFEQMSDLVIVMDGEGNRIYASPAAKRILGYEPNSMVNANALDIVHPEDVPACVNMLHSLPVDGEAVSITMRIRHQHGHYIWLESNIRCLSAAADGRPLRIATISRDVTERKYAEAALAAARERAEAASATKSRFLANMSHELRTPLNAIIGFSDIIHRELFGPAGNPQYKEYARLIQDSGAHLLDLINDVLDMSKIEAGKFDLRLEELDLEDVVRSCMTLMEPHARKSRLMLVSKLGQPHRAVRADRRAVKQILLNLITNAIKFTPPGGLVTVSIENLMDGVALQVSDTGIGIPPEDIERVTQPFEQVTSDPMLAQSGSGLGLALVQSMVGMHMGKLKIDSVQGQGTVVSVFLPFDPRSRRAA